MSQLTWILANWEANVAALGVIGAGVSTLVGLLPQSASRNRVIAALERLSALSHRDSPGTFKLPGTTHVQEPSVVVAPSEPGASGR